ncbi:hypothetical protein ABMA58_11810 [Oceanospirillum sp. HFRX-1_2]
MNQDISSLRRVFDQEALTEKDLADNPFDQFRVWFDQAVESEPFDPNAMTLSTISPENRRVLHQLPKRKRHAPGGQSFCICCVLVG